jgi:transposase-like protein
MPKGKKVSAEQAVEYLQAIEEQVGKGMTVEAACLYVGVARKSYYRWRNLYAGRTVAEAQELSRLRVENTKLRSLIASQAIDIAALKDVLRGKP